MKSPFRGRAWTEQLQEALSYCEVARRRNAHRFALRQVFAVVEANPGATLLAGLTHCAYAYRQATASRIAIGLSMTRSADQRSQNSHRKQTVLSRESDDPVQFPEH